MSARMSEKERTLWEQAVRVLMYSSVTTVISVEPRGAQRVLAKAREQAIVQRKA